MADDRNPNSTRDQEEVGRTSEEDIVTADDDEFEDADDLEADGEEIEEQ